MQRLEHKLTACFGGGRNVAVCNPLLFRRGLVSPGSHGSYEYKADVEYRSNWYVPVSVSEAVSRIKSCDRVYIQEISGAPGKLVQALVDRGRNGELADVEILHVHIEGPAPHLEEDWRGIFNTNNLFIGPNAREAVNTGIADFTPIFLSDVPFLFTRKVLPLDVALLSVSPPDEHGFCSLGPAGGLSATALHEAKYVIAQVNRNVPRAHGDGIVHISAINSVVEVNDPLPERIPVSPENFTSIEYAIGENCAGLIPDGACLQMGIGNIPDSVLHALRYHKKLGVHTELMSDGVIELMECGAVTNELKTTNPYISVSAFALGTKKLYDFMHNNPSIRMMNVTQVNDPSYIAMNDKVHAINSCIEIDLTGQVCSDSIGVRMYSGVGGQIDFMRGAARSQGGKPILALPSITSRKETRIVPILKPGAGVVTTRAHVHYVVTEHGVAYLFGRTLEERARALINIAHPDHRDSLSREWRKLHPRPDRRRS